MTVFWTQPDADHPGLWCVCANEKAPVVLFGELKRDDAEAILKKLNRLRTFARADIE